MSHLLAAGSWPGILAIVVVLGLGFVGTWFGFRSLKRKRLIENVPTSKVRGVFLGLTEVKGRIRSDDPLVSYLAERACVHYTYSIEEHWKRTETTTDSKGKTRTTTRTGWETVASGGEFIPFDLEDDTGRLFVDPHRAEVQGDVSYSRSCGRGDPDYYGKGPGHSVSNSTHRRRFRETILGIGSRVYVMGCARLREDVVSPMIAYDPEAELFLVSTRPEEKIARSYGWKSLGLVLLAALMAFALPIVLAIPNSRGLEDAARGRVGQALGSAAIYGGIVVVFYLVLVYNGLVSVRERAEMAWSMIDVQLKRRHDLIPRLVACVKGAAAHEATIQERLAALRVEGIAGGSVGEGSDLARRQGQVLHTVFALAESYPDLRTSANFRALHEKIVDAEDRIALAREFFNETVAAMNTRIQTLPDALLAKLGGFRERAYFARDGFERSPRLDFTHT